MNDLAERLTDETEILLRDILIGQDWLTETEESFLEEYITRSRTLRDAAAGRRWSELIRLSSECAAVGLHGMIQQARRMSAAVDLSSKVARHGGVLASVMGPDELIEEIRETFDNHLMLHVDGLLAGIHGRLNLALESELISLDLSQDDYRAFITGEDTHVDKCLGSLYSAWITGDRESARQLCLDVLSAGTTHLSRLLELYNTLYRSKTHPFSATGRQVSRVWAAGAGLSLSSVIRHYLALQAVAGDMLLELEGQTFGPGGSTAPAFDIAPENGLNASVGRLAGASVNYEGQLVETSGVVANIDFVRDGSKFNTFLTVSSGFRDTDPSIQVRSHFQDLISYGLSKGAFIWLTGSFSTQHEWANGQPAVEIDRIPLSQLGWKEQRLHHVEAVFDLYPRGSNVAWSLSHHGDDPNTDPQGALEIVNRPVVRER